MRFDSFVGPSYTLDSVRAECQRTVNLYPELDETGQGKNKFTFVPTPGLKKFIDSTDIDPAAGVIRGLWSGAGRLFVAAGGKFFEVDGTGALVGTVHNIADDMDHTPVQIFSNGGQLFIISAGYAYVDNGLGPTLVTFPPLGGKVNVDGYMVEWVSDIVGGAETSDKFDVGMNGQTITIDGVGYMVYEVLSDTLLRIDFNPGVLAGKAYSSNPLFRAVTGAFLDGYFIANRWIDNGGGVHGNTKWFNICALRNGVSWDPVDFAEKEGFPDNIVALLADHQELWLFGAETAEVWRDTGNADFPLQRDPAAVIHQGCLAAWSPVSIGGMVGWIGADSRGGPVAYLAEGYNPKRVSTHAIEQKWRTLTPAGTMYHARSFAYQENGHAFWVITVPFGAVNTAWVYDLTTGQWHERGRWDPLILPSGAFGPPGYTTHTYLPEWEDTASGKSGHIVGGPSSGNLYHLSLDYSDDDGADIVRQRTAPHIVNEMLNQFFHRLRLDIDVESGAPTPTVKLEISRDGGKTWGTARAADLVTTACAAWRRLGRARDCVFRVTVTGKKKVWIFNAYLDMTGGTA